MKLRLKDGTGTIELKYLCEDMDRHGNVRLYVQKRGHAKIRLRQPSGTEAFLAEYHDAVAQLRSPRPKEKGGLVVAARGTLRWLVEQYYSAAEFRSLQKRTRYVRRRLLEALCHEHGTKPFAQMEPRHVRKIRDEKSELPAAANMRVKALRQVFTWAIAADLVSRNPAKDVPYLRSSSEGFHTWTTDEVHQFMEKHPIGTMARLAVALLLFTGARRSDVVRFGPQMISDGWLRFTEAKGQSRMVKTRELPVLPELQKEIDAAPSGHLAFLVTAFQKPFTANGFGNWFRKRCDEAGLVNCSAHGLRKAGATIAADHGATEHQLMAIFGWATPKEAARYTRKANRKRLAGSAMHYLVPDQKMNK